MSIMPAASMLSAAERRPRRTAAETREHVLAVATELFYWEGIRATGVDRVAAEAGVAPTTLYRLFASKDDLVAAYIERAAAGYRELVAEATAPAVGSPRDRVLNLFDVQREYVRPDVCRGCPFLMALAEYPDAASGAHAGAVAAKAWVRERLRAVTAEMDVADPDALADQLALVMEGVYASVQALGVEGPTAVARSAAAALIDAG
jgi:AcrR family transcriptional regulator